jgi:protein-L-isoaspartate(D-aspartate) O-methyltransferase
MHSREELIEHLAKETGVLNNPLVRGAFESVDRADFVSEDYKCEAYEDYPLPIGRGQTISQPTTVAFMLELLDPKEGNKVLDVGCGSGWTTTLLSRIVGKNGQVTGVEIIPELVALGKRNIGKYADKNKNIKIEQAETGQVGKVNEKYDRILVSASSDELPAGLLSQLSEGGILVIPIKNSIWRIKKLANGQFDSKEYPGFVFVPLV